MPAARVYTGVQTQPFHGMILKTEARSFCLILTNSRAALLPTSSCCMQLEVLV